MWAMGVTLYELLNGGKRPWGNLSSTEQEMMAAIEACPPAEKVQQLVNLGGYSVGLQVRGAGGWAVGHGGGERVYVVVAAVLDVLAWMSALHCCLLPRRKMPPTCVATCTLRLRVLAAARYVII
jgi:hypothetical protein